MKVSIAMSVALFGLAMACGNHGRTHAEIEAENNAACEGPNPPIWCPMKCQNCGGHYCIDGFKAWQCNVNPRQGDLCPGGCDDCSPRRQYEAARGCVGGPTGADGAVRISSYPFGSVHVLTKYVVTVDLRECLPIISYNILTSRLC